MYMQYENITEANLEMVAASYVETFSAAPWHEPWTMEVAKVRLCDMLSGNGALGISILDEKKNVLGAAVGEIEVHHTGRQFYLRECFIVPHKQRAGLGKELVRTLENILQDLGVCKIYLLTARESVAQFFYEKNGYSSVIQIGMMQKAL